MSGKETIPQLRKDSAAQKDVKGSPGRENSWSKGMGLRDNMVKVRTYSRFCTQWKSSNMNFTVKTTETTNGKQPSSSACRMISTAGKLNLKR